MCTENEKRGNSEATGEVSSHCAAMNKIVYSLYRNSVCFYTNK